MGILDDPEKIKEIDKSGVYQSIESLDEQCWDAWQKVQAIKIPDDYRNFTNLVVCGMGGSALGAHVIQKLYQEELKVPLVIVRDDHLPGFVNQDSLVILSSYSGNTEETLNCVKEAVKKKVKLFIITSGGKLKEFSEKNSIPSYLINPLYNPCGQPRMAVGYSIFGQLALFSKLGLIQLNKEGIRATIQFIKVKQKEFSITVSTQENQAKKLAVVIERKIPIIIVAEHLVGAAHVFNNQLNENAKHFSEFRSLPELNHHLMEGLAFPKTNQKNLNFLFIDSPFYSSRIQQRFDLTEDVVTKNKIATTKYQVLDAKNKLEEVFCLITFGAFVSFYLAMQHQLDPTPIPWVDYFKNSLKKFDKQRS